MYLTGKILYNVLDRCEDLFPDWVREHDQFWNRKTGEIVTKNGQSMHDLVYRPDLSDGLEGIFSHHDECSDGLSGIFSPS